MAVALALVLFFTAVCTDAVDIDCNDGQFYIRADPESCRHFYKCDNGRPVRFTCPDTLYYNPSLHVCDWPQNVKCGVNKGTGSSNNGGQQYNNNGHSSTNNAAQNVNNNKYPSNQNSAAQQYNNNGYSSTNNAAQNVNNNKYPANQNNGNNPATGQQYSRPPGANQVEPYPDYDNLYDEVMYPTPDFNQGYSGSTQNADVGPSVQDPLGDHERPRPTVDQLYGSNSHPYQEYLGSNSIDIRK